MKIVLLLATSAFLVVLGAPASADSCGGGAAAAGNVFVGSGECSENGAADGGHADQTSHGNSYYEAYRWELACDVAVGNVHTCIGGCPQGLMPYRLIGTHNGQEFTLDVRCASNAPDAAPTVTPDLVARAFQRIPLPALRSVTQPADKTLINFDTIFYVDAQPLHRTLTLLGQRVELEITPSTFRWVHGDGTTSQTSTPGAAYPAKDVVHRYQHAHLTVRQHVEIVWTARWRLNGGPLQDVDGTVRTVGPETPLRVAEATPALSGYGH